MIERSKHRLRPIQNAMKWLAENKPEVAAMLQS
jgi:hypothetical protein